MKKKVKNQNDEKLNAQKSPKLQNKNEMTKLQKEKLERLSLNQSQQMSEEFQQEIVEAAIKTMKFRQKRGTRMKDLMTGKLKYDGFWEENGKYFGGNLNLPFDEDSEDEQYEQSSSGQDEFDSDFDQSEDYPGKRGRKKVLKRSKKSGNKAKQNLKQKGNKQNINGQQEDQQKNQEGKERESESQQNKSEKKEIKENQKRKKKQENKNVKKVGQLKEIIYQNGKSQIQNLSKKKKLQDKKTVKKQSNTNYQKPQITKINYSSPQSKQIKKHSQQLKNKRLSSQLQDLLKTQNGKKQLQKSESHSSKKFGASLSSRKNSAQEPYRKNSIKSYHSGDNIEQKKQKLSNCLKLSQLPSISI